MNIDQRLIEFTQALAAPLRLAILQHLMGGPATVSQLISVTGASQSKVSNHLALLRERRLVRSTRQARQIIYELRDPSVAQLVESLVVAADAVPTKVKKSPPLARARTCYDHLAGTVGVALFDSLVNTDAVEEPTVVPGGSVILGPSGPRVFGKLGIDLESLQRERRRFAFACLDWTERRPHLGGALGAALWAQFLERGWVVKQPGTRIVILTETGKQGLGRYLNCRIEDPRK